MLQAVSSGFSKNVTYEKYSQLNNKLVNHWQGPGSKVSTSECNIILWYDGGGRAWVWSKVNWVWGLALLLLVEWNVTMLEVLNLSFILFIKQYHPSHGVMKIEIKVRWDHWDNYPEKVISQIGTRLSRVDNKYFLLHNYCFCF